MFASFTTSNSADPVSEAKRLVASSLPTEGDLLYALQRERSRILKRTGAGVDAQGASFSPYSAGYAKRKSKYRDGGTVDLRGRNAPHMLQAMLVNAGGLQESGDSDKPAVNGAIAFYDERAALLARVHNEGATVPTRLGKGKGKPKKGGASSFRVPRRHFFEATADDLTAIENDIGSRIEARSRARGRSA